MKKVLVFGQNSYIGKMFANYGSQQFTITTISARSEAWKALDFSAFDAVLFCAGIAHVAQKKAMGNLYYRVNCQLAVEVAKAAKDAGVGQFVFLSSVAVYGHVMSNGCAIPQGATPKATDLYGGSKLAAETELMKLGYNICILRPPMVYGPGCKGNFPKLVRLAKILPIFPQVANQRSMVYIDNLCKFICIAIEENKTGIHLPQNTEYVNTTALVQAIAKEHGKTMATTPIFNPLIGLLRKFMPPVDKLFGSLCYSHARDEEEYNVVGFDDTVVGAVNIDKRGAHDEKKI